jgi:ABC-type transport system involved in multi-copper enzyme maturation permease subunit
MIFARVGRLVWAELIKVFSQPILYIFLIIMIGLIPFIAYLQIPRQQGAFYSLNAIQVFAYGCKYGLKMAALFGLIFGCLIFAGESDKGTIKNLLVRPVSRMEIFLAKSLTVLGVTFLFVGIALYTSLIYGMLRGDLADIWDTSEYYIHRTYQDLMIHFLLAIRVALPAFLAVAFFSIIISNLTESLGYAIAMTMTLFVVLEFLSGFGMLGKATYHIFSYFPEHAFNCLIGISEGKSSIVWKRDIIDNRLYIFIPLGYSVAFGLLGYLRFRWKDVYA